MFRHVVHVRGQERTGRAVSFPDGGRIPDYAPISSSTRSLAARARSR